MATLLFRADATPAMGTGHVMRCLAVAEAAAELGHACHMAAAAATPAVVRRLADAGLPLHRLEAPPGSAADLALTRALAAALDARTVIIDGYHFDTDWRAGLRAELRADGRRVLAFDDLAGPEPLHADLVVNASPAADPRTYARLAPGAVCLLGPAYAPLRREIREAARRPPAPPAGRTSILLTFGGSDPLGLTAPCLERLAPDLPPGCRLTVAVGGSDPRADEVAAAARRFGGRVAVHRDSPAMGALMAAAGLAVSAGGGTLAELAALAVPTVLVVVADNQAPPPALTRTPAAAAWGPVIDARALDPADAADRIAEAAWTLWRDPDARAELAARGRGRVDGEGAVRIARHL